MTIQKRNDFTIGTLTNTVFLVLSLKELMRYLQDKGVLHSFVAGTVCESVTGAFVGQIQIVK